MQDHTSPLNVLRVQTTPVLSDKQHRLLEPPITDPLMASNASRSSIELVGTSKLFYTVGDEIKVHIEMFNGYKYRKSSGGDYLKVWMRDRRENASSVPH